MSRVSRSESGMNLVPEFCSSFAIKYSIFDVSILLYITWQIKNKKEKNKRNDKFDLVPIM